MPRKAETFELSEKAYPSVSVSTTKILSNYSRDPPPEIPDAVLQERRLAMREHAKTVEELRKWVRHRESSMIGKVLRIFLNHVKIRMPSEQKLYHSINHFFPPRFDILVTICDFGDGRAEHREVRLGDIEQGVLEARERKDALLATTR